MVINCTLAELAIPGIIDFTPEFGTKRPDEQSITTREHNHNMMLPFLRQRPWTVTEDSVTSEIEAHGSFALKVPGIALTLGDGGFIGCEVRVVNVANNVVRLIYGEGKTLPLSPGEKVDLVWSGDAWMLPPTYSLNSYADAAEGRGRDLLKVLKVSSISELMKEMRRLCNNAGELDASKVPDFSSLYIGDYFDLPNLIVGDVAYPYNPVYKNLRLVLSGMNQYKGSGDTENAKNHLLFMFRNCVHTRQMNLTDTNTGGYAATNMKTYLEGDFKAGLLTALGEYLYPVRRLLSTKGSWAWEMDTVFLPTEYEVFGAPVWSEVGYGGGFQCQFPIFQRSSEYLVKRLNGARNWWWLASPYAGSGVNFCAVTDSGHAHNHGASASGGCAPAFCVA